MKAFSNTSTSAEVRGPYIDMKRRSMTLYNPGWGCLGATRRRRGFGGCASRREELTTTTQRDFRCLFVESPSSTPALLKYSTLSGEEMKRSYQYQCWDGGGVIRASTCDSDTTSAVQRQCEERAAL